jgi:hypothetical protein
MERVFSVEKRQIDQFIAQLTAEKDDVRKEKERDAALERLKHPMRSRVEALLLAKKEDVRNGLAVKSDHPVLRSVLTLMDAKQQAHVEAAGVVGLYADEAKAEARCVIALQEMQEIILEEVEKGRSEER